MLIVNKNSGCFCSTTIDELVKNLFTCHCEERSDKAIS